MTTITNSYGGDLCKEVEGKFEKIALLDYLVLGLLVVSIILYYLLKVSSYGKYRGFIVLLAALIFFSYWILRIVFNKKYENLIAN